MNNDDARHKRNTRNQTLILVEGEHERSVVLRMFLRCFPDINIPYENVHVYGGKIYDLYDAIEAEYGEQVWEEEGEDINLPLLISKREEIIPVLDKRNFSNIFLIFDYEYQDSKFSVNKIMRLQRHFCSPTDDGILYINYPMVEAYKDMSEIPDAEYYKKKFTGIDQPGVFYKNQVKAISVLEKYLGVYEKVIKYCRKYHLSEGICVEFADELLSLKNDADLKDELGKLECFSEELRENMQHYMCNLIKQYVPENMSYWDRLRELFVIVASQNISKGYSCSKEVMIFNK